MKRELSTDGSVGGVIHNRGWLAIDVGNSAHSVEMDVIQAFAETHGGVFTRSVALDAGVTDLVMQRHVKKGRWVRLRRGIYIDADSWRGLSPEEQHIAMAHAVSLRCHGNVVFSHVTGAVIRGWPTWNIPLDTVCVTRRTQHASRIEAGVHHFDATLPDDQIETVNGLQVCSSERLMVEIAREYGFEEAVVICDAALRAGADRDRAKEVFLQTYGWPKSSGVAAVLDFADGRAENPGESRLRVALHVYGVEGFEPQVVLRAPNGRVLGRGDLVDRKNRVLIEFDGKSKYGIEGKDPRQQVWDEKVREDEVRRELDYEVRRYYWRHLDNQKLIADWALQAQARGQAKQRRAA